MPPPFRVQPDSAKSKPDSNPIEHGPAQFNAFYPQQLRQQCQARLGASGRSTADRILSIIRTGGESIDILLLSDHNPGIRNERSEVGVIVTTVNLRIGRCSNRTT